MDPGIGHEIEADLQAYGYPILWVQYLPIDPDLLEWLFGEDIYGGHHRSPFDIGDVWPSSYSGNTNEILWGAKVAARIPWVTCVIRLTSYECGMDQPTFTAGAADRRALRDAVFLVPGSRLHQAGGIGEDPGRNHRALPAEIWRGHDCEKEGGRAGGLSLAG